MDSNTVQPRAAGNDRDHLPSNGVRGCMSENILIPSLRAIDYNGALTMSRSLEWGRRLSSVVI